MDSENHIHNVICGYVIPCKLRTDLTGEKPFFTGEPRHAGTKLKLLQVAFPKQGVPVLIRIAARPHASS